MSVSSTEIVSGADGDSRAGYAGARLRDHPRFGDAMQGAAAAAIAHYAESRLLNTLQNDRGRLAIGLAIIDLHFRGLEDPADGLTTQRLQNFCRRHDLASPGRVQAMLAALRLFGLVEAGPSPDNRTRGLRATQKFIDMTRARWTSLLAGAEPVLPELPAARTVLDDPRFIAAYAGHFVSRFELGHRVLDASPALAAVSEHTAGFVIMLSFLDGAPWPAGTRPVNVSRLARQFVVSRSHVVDVLARAEACGLIRRDGNSVELTPAYAEALVSFYENAFQWFREGIAAGLAATR